MTARKRGAIFIVFGVILAVVVGALVFLTIQNGTAAGVTTKEVVVAAQDILDRTVIQPGAVAIKKMPAESIPPGAYTKTSDVVGKMAPTKIYAGEIILSSKLVDSKGQSGLSFTMTKGRVLITFPASNIIGLGLVRPGDAVDVLVTYNPAKNRSAQQPQTQTSVPQSVTLATMQNLKVVTIGRQASATESPTQQGQQQGQQPQITSVTFAVEPQDALTLKAMKDSEDLIIEVALRAAGDEDTYKTEPVTVRKALESYGFTPNLLTQ